jgi:hypothetical protein
METLRHKVVVVAEQEGAERAEYSLRVAMSEGTLTVLVPEKGEDGRIVTRKHEVPGPACFITTTTRAQVHDENETRVLEVNLDESPEQTQRIIHAQALAATRPRTDQDKALAEQRRSVWRAVLTLVEPLEVVVPQAMIVAQRFPIARVRNRRDFPKVLSLAAAHALLHQHQRQRQPSTHSSVQDAKRPTCSCDRRRPLGAGAVCFTRSSYPMSCRRGSMPAALRTLRSGSRSRSCSRGRSPRRTQA